MRISCTAACLGSLLLVGLLQAAPNQSPNADSFKARVTALLDNYCIDCHGGPFPEADIDLEKIEGGAADVDKDPDKWKLVLNMLESRMMPPEGELQPSADELGKAVEWLKAKLTGGDREQPCRPGRVTLRRLNRVEYHNTIRDLVGIDYQGAADFPSDDVGEGFDNIGDVLSLPPLLLEKYMGAAEEIVRRAFASPETRRRILICRPGPELSRADCARKILAAFAGRAYRRPATEEEVGSLVRLAVQAERRGAEGLEPLQVALRAVLVSPHFLFRVERDPKPSDPGGVRALDGYELATRLSYFLWSSMPDDALFQLARDGKLQQDDVLVEQVTRMLRDPKSEALVKNFAGQWLQLRSLADASPDPDRFPEFDEALRRAMLRETESFVAALIRQDGSVLDFLDADYTYVNERLAKHYGVAGVQGDVFRRVPAPEHRRGVLTHASILTVTSNPTRTSPVKRGKWILENILGTPPPPPPPNVPELKEGEAKLLGTLRERMEQHRADPICASCHEKMDPLGFALENFDAVGHWRSRDDGLAIDASGTLPNGQAFDGPGQLMEALKSSQKELFRQCLAKKMLTYALGRGLESYDHCAVDGIVERLTENEYRFSALAAAIVLSEPFRMRGAEGGKP